MHGGWHIFSQNPGDVGVPTEVKWRLPMGFEVKEQSWSPDVKFITDEIVQYGYDKTCLLQNDDYADAGYYEQSSGAG
ncbi:MAG: hypothetical protein ACLU99_07570 [Alphaproteobacteria bacterium]